MLLFVLPEEGFNDSFKMKVISEEIETKLCIYMMTTAMIMMIHHVIDNKRQNRNKN